MERRGKERQGMAPRRREEKKRPSTWCPPPPLPSPEAAALESIPWRGAGFGRGVRAASSLVESNPHRGACRPAVVVGSTWVRVGSRAVVPEEEDDDDDTRRRTTRATYMSTRPDDDVDSGLAIRHVVCASICLSMCTYICLRLRCGLPGSSVAKRGDDGDDHDDDILSDKTA
ncbi:hypothetical protein XA68_16314 [Ophiocordyceps unilateralis]|uniref:Uncharacterized protein n=1 Tax=Ophiocordyceps unilateralis TaxID=268505 RepID=A0A2A9PJV8_OPHUN|nr:hypothetical protein XA68_16314 [Ophiocordyceps unilateralis]